MTTVEVYEWVFEDGVSFGCGTKAEFDYWTAEGVNPEGSKLGAVIGREPASEDDRRRAAWAA